MKYELLSQTYDKLEHTSSRLAKIDILANLFKETPSDVLPKTVFLIQGIVFPKYSGYELGIAIQMMLKAIAKATGFSVEEIETRFKKTGDLGNIVEECIKSKKQSSLFKKQLDVNMVFKNLQQIAFITGSGSQDKKLNLISELLVSAKPQEAKYIVRTILGDLRIGVADGVIRDSIAKAFLSNEDKEKSAQILERALNILPDFSEIAIVAKNEGVNGLKKLKVKVGSPIQVMLGEKAESINELVDKYGKVAVEYKYDGMRAQIHKKDDKIWIYTRRLEDVTKQFPDLVNLCKKSIKPKECIVEGEVIGLDPKTGRPVPFQIISQRIHRKYEIEKTIQGIPIQVNLFDALYIDGEMLFDKPLKERRKILEKAIKPMDKIICAKQIVTKDVDIIETFYKNSLAAGQEGLFIKLPDSKYVFGRHVDGWYKIKPTMETLDLAIIGATWGTGKRAGWMGSFILGCKDENTNTFLECGMLGTGVKEKKVNDKDITFKELTELLRPLIISEKGTTIKIKPKVVISVDYQEIQKSPNYESGFALRFPRFIAFREDKSPDDADTVERIKYLYSLQKKR